MRALETIIRSTARLAICGVMVLATVGCQTAPEDSDWLYHQLGEREGIAKLNETFVLKIAQDDRISDFFEDTDIARFHELLTEQFCVLAGGPCSYTGETMLKSHHGLDIDSANFNALVEDLILAMEAENIPTAAQNRLLAQLAPMHKDIVGEHPLPPTEDP